MDDAHMISRQCVGKCGLLNLAVELNVDRKGVRMEGGRLDQHQRRYRQVVAGDRLEMRRNASLNILKRNRRALSKSAQHVERYLFVEHFFGQSRKRQQIDS